MIDDPQTETPHEPRDDMTASMFGDDAMPVKPGGGPDPGYLVLARKYRPTSFDDLIGQEAMVTTLSNAFRLGRVAHAFMLTGVRGVGKTTTARLLARALNYEADGQAGPSLDLEPKGRHCDAIMSSRHPDVLELDAASRTSVAEMRELLDGARYTPNSARYKVYIIDEVHMLSINAFNALLKTLEEPPEHVKFIFATTEIRKVPVTVLSRCQRFDLKRLGVEPLTLHLKNICEAEGAAIEDEGLALIAQAAEGSVRDALSILDQAILSCDPGTSVKADAIRDMIGLADRGRLLELFAKAISGDRTGALEEVDDQLAAGADPTVMLKELTDLAVEVSRAEVLGEAYRAPGPASWAVHTRDLSKRLSPAQASRLWQVLMRGLQIALQAPDVGKVLQMTVLQMASAMSLPSPEDAARQLLGSAQSRNGPASPPSEPASRSPQSEVPSATTVIPEETDESVPDRNVEITLGGIVEQLEAGRAPKLRYDVSKYLRPGKLTQGYLSCSVDEGAPESLLADLNDFLERNTGLDWDIELKATDAETYFETQERLKQQRIGNGAADTRDRECPQTFSGG